MNIWADVGQHLWTFFALLVWSYLKLEGDIPLLGPTAMSSIESGHLSNLKWVYLSWIRAYLPRQSRLKDVLGLWISNANRLSLWPPTTTNQFSCFPPWGLPTHPLLTPWLWSLSGSTPGPGWENLHSVLHWMESGYCMSWYFPIFLLSLSLQDQPEGGKDNSETAQYASERCRQAGS